MEKMDGVGGGVKMENSLNLYGYDYTKYNIIFILTFICILHKYIMNNFMI